MKYIYKTITFTLLYFVSTSAWSQTVTLYNADSTVRGTGIMQDGSMEGMWKFVDPSNQQVIQQGHFAEGKKDGRWVAYHPGGKPRLEAEYRNDVLNGLYREYDNQGALIVESVFEDSVLVGPYKTYYGAESPGGTRRNQIKTEGQFENGKRTGEWISYFPNGQIAMRQNYKNGRLEGPYREYSQYGELLVEANYKDNKPHGQYVRKTENEMVVEQGEFDMGRRVGTWISYFPFTKTVESERNYDNRGNRSGEWKYYYENRRLARVENYKNDLPTGTWEEYFPNRNLAKRKSYNELGLPEGPYVEYHSNNNLSVEGQYESGVRTGLWKNYFPDGKVYSVGEYRNDVKAGLWKYFNKIGVLIAEGEYELGSEHGQWFYYYDGGQLKSVGSYFYGFEDGVWGLFYDNRQLTQEETWANGRLMSVGDYYSYDGETVLDKGTLQNGNGTRITYYVNGRKESEGNYSAGKPEGDWKYYHDNGRLASEGRMEDGMKEGQWKYYNRNGRLDEVILFENDEVVPLEVPEVGLEFQNFN